jgi:hypothetical protein
MFESDPAFSDPIIARLTAELPGMAAVSRRLMRSIKSRALPDPYDMIAARLFCFDVKLCGPDATYRLTRRADVLETILPIAREQYAMVKGRCE